MASTSCNQTPSSSATPTSIPTLWDVFLSFRGNDTRYTFTDHLYKALHRTGIRTFMDKPELRSGEVISDSLIQAIQESKTYIVVLSENYASSSWCLDELAEILSCYKRMKRLVVPVFYYIDPSVVRHQIGSFKEAFEKHQTRFPMEKVDKWRLTLNQVADFSGYHISKNRSQADIIDEVVDRVSLEINPKTLYVAKYPVGLDSRLKDITALLNTNTEGVIRIGIHGMGGVGKTTLAKALYNQNYQRFQGSCFLANVREVSRTENGLVGLQHQLIVDVLKCNNLNIGNKDQGIELIRARVCSTKVLLVVDDLDNSKPLEYLEGSFASGSMIVITTRNEDLLDRIQVKAKYKVNQMDKDESRQLFTQHAFREDNISHIFTKLSNEILENAGGLPLAFQVFGSTLLDESEDGWRWFIDKLKRAPIDDVEENLMISFDSLKSIDPNLQDIFLDIACFYIGWKKKKVAKILETCYTFVNRKVDILQKRCLITISSDDKLGMHDLLRDMGRKIARNNSPDEPGKHSRLWVLEDIDTVLKNNKGTEEIKGIISGYYKYYENRMSRVTLVADSFKRMSKLRFLYLNNVNITGSFEQTFEDLRWLRWAFCHLECLPSDFYAEKLVTLELPHSNMRTWEAPHEFKKLKTLNMSGSRILETTPNFIRLPCLETLNLKDCSSLEDVHVSIGSLASLVHLNLGGCSDLRSLPDSICSLRALEVLTIEDCRRLEALPSELGSIESLKMLNARGLSVSKLPDSIRRLSNLVELDVSHNENLETLPANICGLVSLEILDISECGKLEELLYQLGKITSLRELNVCMATTLKMLPDISQLSNLKDLDLSGFYYLLSIPELPPNLERIVAKNCMSLEKLQDLSSLKHLKELDLTDCVALKEIQGFEEVTSLKYLTLSNCRSLERLPNLSNLKRLWVLELTNCVALKEIIGLEEHTSLEDLNFSGCGNLLSISKLPPNVHWVDAEGCTSLEKLPDLSSLKHLKSLDLTDCVALKEIQGLEEVTSLATLTLPNCKTLQRLPNLSKLKDLRTLDLTNWVALKEIIGLEELTSLEHLKFSGCGNLLSVSKLPPNMDWVEAEGCTSLKKLPDVSSLKHLKRLDLTDCVALKEIQGFEEVTSLEYLTLSNCWSLERLPNLSNLKHLKRLDLTDCEALKEIIGLEELTSLKDLKFSGCGNLLSVSKLPPNMDWVDAEGCTSLEKLPDLSSLKHLKRLDLTDCVALKEIQGLEEVSSLQDLTLSNCRSLQRFPNLSNLKHLEELDLTDCVALEEIQGFEEVTSLKYLTLSNCTSLEKLPDLSNLKHLEWLDLTNCVALKEIIGLEELTSLEDLNFSGCGNLLSVSKLPPNVDWVDAEGCTSLEKLPDLSSLKHLKRLDLTDCVALKEIQALEEVTSLKDLTLSNCRSLQRLPNISNLKHSEELDLTDCVALEEIQGFEEVTSLEYLTLSNCRSLEILPNLSNLKHLKRLDLTDCEALKEIIGLEELTSLVYLDLRDSGHVLSISKLPPNLKWIDAQSCTSWRMQFISSGMHFDEAFL